MRDALSFTTMPAPRSSDPIRQMLFFTMLRTGSTLWHWLIRLVCGILAVLVLLPVVVDDTQALFQPGQCPDAAFSLLENGAHR
ncbi:hypothetical protein [Desulfosarcina ovata]|uniref:hypothetical protein n=1 Tax=Desulfosarcina ovata TaxID=83564 RepID=UPI0012D34B67|nr:hypothetical protein [Desulfosarcina ovata]